MYNVHGRATLMGTDTSPTHRITHRRRYVIDPKRRSRCPTYKMSVGKVARIFARSGTHTLHPLPRFEGPVIHYRASPPSSNEGNDASVAVVVVEFEIDRSSVSSGDVRQVAEHFLPALGLQERSRIRTASWISLAGSVVA